MDVVPQLLDASATQSERIAALAWILTWATEPDQHQRLQQELYQRRLSDAATADDWSRCLVYLLEQTGQRPQAFTELQALHARRPTISRC